MSDELLVGERVEVDDADWRGLEPLEVNLSLTNLCRIGLTGVGLDPLVAEETSTTQCRLDNAVARRLRLCDRSSGALPSSDGRFDTLPSLTADPT
jgi:hypothetical protein